MNNPIDSFYYLLAFLCDTGLLVRCLTHGLLQEQTKLIYVKCLVPMLIYVKQLAHGRCKENVRCIFNFLLLISLLPIKLHLALSILTHSHIIPVTLLTDHSIYLDRPVKQRLWSPQEGYKRGNVFPCFAFLVAQHDAEEEYSTYPYDTSLSGSCFISIS